MFNSTQRTGYVAHHRSFVKNFLNTLRDFVVLVEEGVAQKLRLDDGTGANETDSPGLPA